MCAHKQGFKVGVSDILITHASPGLKKFTEEFKKEAASQGKPPEIVEKIVSGRLNKYFEEACLLDQSFVKDDEIKVGQLVTDVSGVLGENLVVRRFQRFELGEDVG